MRTTIITNYTFDKAAKTVTFTDFASIDLERILNITDITTGQAIFCSKLAGLSGSVTTNVLTLSFNTNIDNINNSDALLIEYINENEGEQIVASATRSSTYTGSDITNYNHKGVTLFINVTAIADTPSLVVKVQMKDPVSGNYKDIPDALTAAIVATGQTILTIYPGLTIAANAKIDYVLPRVYRVIGTFSSTTSITYSVGALYHN